MIQSTDWLGWTLAKVHAPCLLQVDDGQGSPVTDASVILTSLHASGEWSLLGHPKGGELLQKEAAGN